MFGLGMGEIVVIAIVALLFLGPDRLPSAAKSIGKTIRDLRRHTRDLTSTLEKETDIGDAVRELRSALHDPLPRVMSKVAPPTDQDVQAGETQPEETQPDPEVVDPYINEHADVHVESGVDDVTYPPPDDGAPVLRKPADVVARGSDDGGEDGPKSDHG